MITLKIEVKNGIKTTTTEDMINRFNIHDIPYISERKIYSSILQQRFFISTHS